jgi:hypothetical protein
MRNRIWVGLLAISISTALAAPLAGEGDQRGRGRNRGVETNQARGPKDEQGRGRASSSRTYQDPASAKGYDLGHGLGLSDGREGQRYDPVRYRDYRDADRGYAPSYGSRDGYKTNFRSGFRLGYEDGYREGTRAR